MKKILSILVLAIALFSANICDAMAILSTEPGNAYIMERGACDYVQIKNNANRLTLTSAKNRVNAYWGLETVDKYQIWFDVPDDAGLGMTPVIITNNDTGGVFAFYLFIVDNVAPEIYSEGRYVSWDATEGYEGLQRFQVQRRAKGGKWKTAHEFTKNTYYKAPKGTYQVRVRKVNYEPDFGVVYGRWAVETL